MHEYINYQRNSLKQNKSKQKTQNKHDIEYDYHLFLYSSAIAQNDKINSYIVNI